MAIEDDPAVLDLTDLDFDVERHREALQKIPLLNPDPRSVKPTLRARDVVVFRRPGEKFVILTASPAKSAPAECVIHTTADPDEALVVRADAERYFRRHFPGRTRVDGSEPPAGGSGPYRVFVAFDA